MQTGITTKADSQTAVSVPTHSNWGTLQHFQTTQMLQGLTRIRCCIMSPSKIPQSNPHSNSQFHHQRKETWVCRTVYCDYCISVKFLQLKVKVHCNTVPKFLQPSHHLIIQASHICKKLIIR